MSFISICHIICVQFESFGNCQLASTVELVSFGDVQLMGGDPEVTVTSTLTSAA